MMMVCAMSGCNKELSRVNFTDEDYAVRIANESIPVASWQGVSFDTDRAKARNHHLRRTADKMSLLARCGIVEQNGYLDGEVEIRANQSCLRTLLAVSPVTAIDAAFIPGDGELSRIEERILQLLQSLSDEVIVDTLALEVPALPLKAPSGRMRPKTVVLSTKAGLASTFEMFGRSNNIKKHLTHNLEQLAKLGVNCEKLHGATPVLTYSIPCNAATPLKITVAWVYLAKSDDWCLGELQVSLLQTPVIPAIDETMTKAQIAERMEEIDARYRRQREMTKKYDWDVGTQFIERGWVLYASRGMVR